MDNTRLKSGKYLIVNVRSKNYAALEVRRAGAPVFSATNGPGMDSACYNVRFRQNFYQIRVLSAVFAMDTVFTR